MVEREPGIAEVVTRAFAIFEGRQREALRSSWLAAVRFLPGADQCIAWGMPTLRVDGDLVFSMQGFARHNSVFPGSAVIECLKSELTKTTVTKGTIHFERDAPIHGPLQRKILQACIAQINASYPRSNGQFKEFYRNGNLKVRGRLKSGENFGRV